MKKAAKISIAILAAAILLYAIVAAALAATGTCPAYLNTIPGIRENEKPQTKTWHLFCPLSKRA